MKDEQRVSMTNETMLSLTVGELNAFINDRNDFESFGVGQMPSLVPYIVQEPEKNDIDVVALAKNKIDYERQLSVFGKKPAETALQFWLLGYAEVRQSEKADWTKDCDCGPERIGESWCCNQCGRMVKRTDPDGKNAEEMLKQTIEKHNNNVPDCFKWNFGYVEEKMLIKLMEDFAATKKKKPGDYNDEYTMKLKESINYLEEELTKCKDYAACLEKVENNWIKCSDRLPDKNQRYLCIDPNAFSDKECILTYVRYTMYWYDGSDTYHPTHWMPLPSPPKH